jgi:asparagine synthase (glutamine-hydrolysing)
MCGICGFITNSKTVDHLKTLAKMNNVLFHRGPDDEGFYLNQTPDGDFYLGLGHRRLSIIDLNTGHQPMLSYDESVTIVFNGEIYNFQNLRKELIARRHKFKSDSDTEVVINAYLEYGEHCLSRLRGMFAFALWDQKKNQLFLARDRFGKKPLFIRENSNGLFFASEIKSLEQIPDFRSELDYASIYHYLTYRYVPAPHTLFEDVHKLMPGCFLIWKNGKIRQERYYSPPDAYTSANETKSDPVGIIQEFEKRLDEAVRVRMVSDVPYGMFLSGGIDSSTVLALMSRHSTRPVKTFSVGFDLAEYSELNFAGDIAREFGSEHQEIVVNEQEMMNKLPLLIRYRDAPVSEPSDIPIYLLSLAASQSVKMVLTGEGCDEVLGGYPKHVYDRVAPYYQRIPGPIRRKIFEPLIQSLPYSFRRVKIAVFNLGIEQERDRFPSWFGALSPVEKRNLLDRSLFSGEIENSDYPFSCAKDSSLLRRLLFFDQASWLPDNLLERGDRMTMAASIEARMPFMDHELIEYVSSLPDNWRVRRGTTKYLLRQAIKTIIPKEIINRPKVGFRVPVNKWFQGPLYEYLHEHLLGTDSRTKDYYRKDRLKKVITEHKQGRQNHEKLLWTLLNLEIWHREFL